MSVIKKISPGSWKREPLSPRPPHDRCTPADLDDEVLDFFRESQNERSLLADLDSRVPASAPTHSHLTQVARSAASMFTRDSVLDHIKHLPPISLPALCDLINQHLSLQHARIRSAEVYSQIRPVKHRFIILELSRDGKAPIWLRLDRRRQGSLARIIFRLGADLARDEAMLSADKKSLVGSAKRENCDLFRTNSALGEFNLFLGVISRELVVYTVWPENCYFFCSLIQQYLDAEGGGEYVQGNLPSPDLAANVRHRVQEGVRLMYHIPAPFSLAALFEPIVSQQEWPDLGNLLTGLTDLTEPSKSHFEVRSRTVGQCAALGAQLAAYLRALRRDDDAMLVFDTIYKSFRALSNWRLLASTESPISSRINIANFLHSFHTLLLSLNHPDLALPISAEAIAVERDLYEDNALMWRHKLAVSLRAHCICLREGGRVEQACDASSESVVLFRMLYHHNKAKQSQDLAGALRLHSASLCEAGRFEKACDASAEDVDLARETSWSGPEGHRSLATSLQYQSVTLTAAQRYDDACAASAEGVSVMRSLYNTDTDTSRAGLSLALHEHGISLRKAGRYDKACEVGAEGVALIRLLYAGEASKHREALSVTLEEYGRSLRAAQNEQEAHAASAEAVALKRAIYASNPAAPRNGFLKSLISTAVLLQDSELLNEALIAATEEVRLDRLALNQDYADIFSAFSLELLGQCDQILWNPLFSMMVGDGKVLALHRELCARDPKQYGATFRPRLRRHFDTLRARHLVESCQAGADEVAFWRTLCQNSADRYHVYLRLALRHHGKSLRQAGHFSEACDVGAEDVSLMRVLYLDDPDEWCGDLANSLRHHELALQAAGRYSEACDVGTEHVSLSRMVRVLDSKDRRGQLSYALYYYEVSLRGAGRFGKACDAGAEDVLLTRALFEDDPECWRRDLSLSLYQYGLSLRDGGRFSEACDVSAEDVSLKRVLYAVDPEAWRKELSLSLHQYGLSLRDGGRFREACDAGAEDVSLKRMLYAVDPEALHKEFSLSLHDYGVSLRRVGRFSEACVICEEEVCLKRKFFAVDSEAWRGQLSYALINYETALRAAGRFNEACDAGAEGVSLVRALYADDPVHWRGDLSLSLHHHGMSLRDAGRISEACDVGAEDVSLKRLLWARDQEYWRRELSVSLNQYGASLRVVGRSSEACAVGLEAVVVSHQVYKPDPKDGYKQADYSKILENYCLSLRCEDRILEAMELEEELAAVERLAYQHRD